ncbi:MAG: transporter related protein [Solirubrobacterales bacterium]|nr:transporter related protein [Solirubrobacterales bacterium]
MAVQIEDSDGSALATLAPEGLGGLQVSVRSIHKRYAGARALEDVSVSIARGEIHALVGENGAGKSTLGKIIAGAVAPDEGTISVDGEEVRYRSPREAIRAGIALIDQELATVRDMTALDNVFLGAERRSGGMLDRGAQGKRFDELAERVGFTGEQGVIAGGLRTADQQKIEIMRALVRGARLIVMDEPTAALSRIEADRLLAIARALREEGVTIIFVSHFLEDVLALADTVSVLKDGRHVRTAPAAKETVETMITAMLGRSLEYVFPEPAPPPPDAPVVLKVRNLTRSPAFTDVSFDIRAGEIVGLAGLVGSGRTEIARGIFGADPASGTVEIDGRALRMGSPRHAIRRGAALLPESRKDQGLAMHRSVAENVSMVHLDQVCRHEVLQGRRERRVVKEMLGRVQAKVATPSMPVSALSGGNQQKVALAKWLVRQPKLLIADEPTRGVDVGAKQTIYELLKGLAESGMAVLMISSEIEEVLGLSHRVLVVRGGRIVAEFEGDAAQEESIMRAAFGGTGPGNTTKEGSADAR